MNRSLIASGVFVTVAILLFTGGLFLIGDKHKAFNHHVEFYTSMLDIQGIAVGSKVRVSGLDAGEVKKIDIPDKPSSKFRLSLQIENKLRGLVRADSVVSVESEGLVGDKFILIHPGTDNSQEATPGSTLAGKEQIEISAVIEKVTGVVDEANATIADLNKRVDVALDALTGTINNTNGVVTGIREGKGTVGMLLTDERTSQQVKAAVTNAQQATVNINQLTDHANQMVSDLQSRNLPQKADDAIDNAKSATVQLNQASVKLNASLSEALAPDRSGVNAAQNIRESLGNVNQATANLNDDTEALKHGFLFRGFFKKRGFYTLSNLTPEDYRKQAYFQNPANRREWLAASDLFAMNSQGKESISTAGASQLDSLISSLRETISGTTIVVEGYAGQSPALEQLPTSKARAQLVKQYLEQHYQLNPNNVGIIGLNATPPQASGKSTWDGVCLVLLAPAKKK